MQNSEQNFRSSHPGTVSVLGNLAIAVAVSAAISATLTCAIATVSSQDADGWQVGETVTASDQPIRAAKLRSIGIAKVDITPEYPIRLNGFGFRRDESEGVRQRIWAKAIAIGDDDEAPVILLTVDSLGVRWDMVNDVADRLKERYGIERDRIALTFSHSHTTPKLNGASDTIFSSDIPAEHQAHIDRYTRELTALLVQVAGRALSDRQPRKLEWGEGEVTLAVNRRTDGGPVDHALPVMVIRNANNTVAGIYVSYACHCVTLSENLIGGDWAGYAQVAIERMFPGAIGMVSIGAGSDSNPRSGVVGDRADIAATQGAEIADEVARVIDRDLLPINGAVAVKLEVLELPLETPPRREELERRAATGGAAGYNAQFQLNRLDRGESLMTHLPYPIQTFLFGDDLAMVFLAGEVCVDYSLRLKTELNRHKLWLNAYSNDFGAYIPSERLLKEGGYGGGSEIHYFALPNTLQAGLEQVIIDEVRSQVPKTLHTPEGSQGVPPRDPQGSISQMTVGPRFEVQVAACEPLVADPVAIDFGLDRKLWVVEMPDYAHPVDGDFEPSGRIKFLTDEDGDWRFDRATLFADGFRFPTDVKVWRQGVLVCDAPDIIYLADTDGDNAADVREVLFSGFATHNPHARVNSLRWGLDGWVYGSGGLFGGTVTSFNGATVELGNRDFRCRPDTGEIEPVSGRTQQGRDRNDWGDWFGCDNSTLLRHYPLDARYSARHPLVAAPASATYVPTGDNAGQLFPAGEIVSFQLTGPPGRATSACGLGIYRDFVLGADFLGNSFTCEPVNQLVYRQVLQRTGSTFTGQRASDETASEFLASSDRWFRPVQVRTGPDGTLWVVDMYRYVIEHGRWIPAETRDELDVFAGRDLGRIYRIVPTDRRIREWPSLSDIPAAAVATRISSANGVVRDLVQQTMFWYFHDLDPDLQVLIATTLADIVAGSESPSARMQALCTLDVLDLIIAPVVLEALHDDHPEVLRHAIRIAERIADESPEVLTRLCDLTEQPEPAVKLQLAYSLGNLKSPLAGKALFTIAIRPDNDVYVQNAVLSGVGPHNLGGLLAELGDDSQDPRERDRLLHQLTPLVVHNDQTTHHRTLFELLFKNLPAEDDEPAGRLKRLADWLDQYARQRRVPADYISQEQHAKLVNHISRARFQLESATQQTTSPAQLGRLIAGIKLLAVNATWDSPDEVRRVVQQLAGLLDPTTKLTLQRESISALNKIGSDEALQALLDSIPLAGPSVRADLRAAVTSRPAWIGALLSRLEHEAIPISVVGSPFLDELANHPNAEIQQRAAVLRDALAQTPRGELVEQYLGEMQDGNVSAGQLVFLKHCAACHRWGHQGRALGPDLTGLVNRNRQSLVTSILDPNRDVDARYLNYVVETHDGRVLAGLITDEADTSFRVVDNTQTEREFLRVEVAGLTPTTNSYMPEGLEEEISPQAMSDLVTLLLAPPSTPKSFIGNLPQQVTPRSNGLLQLTAKTAEIYGHDIRFEGPPFDNIGYWHSESDYVMWRVEDVAEGAYEVWLEYACHDSSQGSELVVRGGLEPLAWTVKGTGEWNRYSEERIGVLKLAGDTPTVSIGVSKLKSRALIDLRSMELRPRDE